MKDMVIRLSGTKIGEVLSAQGRRQDWLAEQVGVSPSTVNRWISGTRSVDLGNAERIAALLDVDLFLLFDVPIGTCSDLIGKDRKDAAA